MKTKVCPICDQPIHGMYCKGCKKIVLHPVEQNITYFLNTRHPEFETNCSYHNDIPRSAYDANGRYRGSSESPVRNAAHRMTVSETEAKKTQIKERMAARKQEQKTVLRRSGNIFGDIFGQSGGSSHPTVLNGDVVRKNKSSGTNSAVKKMLIGIIIYLILSFGSVIGILVGNIADVFDGFTIGSGASEIVMAPEPIEAPAVDIDWDAPEPDMPLNDWERSDEEVKSAGIACTGYGHFSVGYSDDLRETFESCVEDAGFRIWEEFTYSHNSQLDSDSWYVTTYEFSIDSEEDYIGTIEFEADTATGELHGFSVYNSDEKHFYELLNVLLKFMQEAGVIRHDLPSAEEFYEEARWKNVDAQKEKGYVMLDGLEVSCYVPDESVQEFFSLSIYAPGYMSLEGE